MDLSHKTFPVLYGEKKGNSNAQKRKQSKKRFKGIKKSVLVGNQLFKLKVYFNFFYASNLLGSKKERKE